MDCWPRRQPVDSMSFRIVTYRLRNGSLAGGSSRLVRPEAKNRPVFLWRGVIVARE